MKYALKGILILSLVLTGCREAFVPQIAFAPEEVEELPLTMSLAPDDTLYRVLRHRDAVVAFYQSTGQRPVWVDSEEGKILADSMIFFIRNARYFGLLPEGYHLTALTAANRLWWRPEHRQRREVLLTDAFLSVASDLGGSRISGHKPDTNTIALLHSVINSGGLQQKLEAQQPDFAQYHALRRALVTLIDSSDPDVRTALKRGITSDSIPIQGKVRTIEINLERWRQEQERWSSRYIFVNIPSYMLELIENDRRVLETRAIVGKPEHATPEFSSTVQCFVTYPYWHVPRKISVSEFLPVIQRDTTFLRRNNFDVLDRKGNVLHPDSIPWKSFHKNNFPVVLRQREGPENSLGILKFVFDNPYAVFVHDTNAPRLFNLRKRALSHGCIRIERAVDLAHYLVTGDPGKKSPSLEAYLNEKLRHTVELSRPISIHIRYLTAATDRNGKLVFFEDVYRKDGEMADKLYRRRPVFTRAEPWEEVQR